MMLPFVVLAAACTLATAEFAPSNSLDWVWWKLGRYPTWGENSIGITTSFGRIQAWTFGNRGSGNSESGYCAVTLHGGMDVDAIHHDFDNISTQLVNQFGYFVISPNFHSNPATRPGKISTAQMATLMLELAKWGGCKRYSMVLGKGWGGAMAARVSVGHPSIVHKMVLIAPGPLREDFRRDKFIIITVNTLLLYAQDDSSINSWAMQAIKKHATNLTQGHGNYRGGHKMIPQFNDDIIWFAKRYIPDVDEEEEEAVMANPSHSEEL